MSDFLLNFAENDSFRPIEVLKMDKELFQKFLIRGSGQSPVVFLFHPLAGVIDEGGVGGAVTFVIGQKEGAENITAAFRAAFA